MGMEAYFNKRVMIADDLKNMRDDLNKILKNLGFTNINEKPDGKTALDELKYEAQVGNPYGVIFSDINMPQINGITLLKTIRLLDSYKKTPFFIVSTVTEKDTIVQAILGGATDYIIKPYSADVVKEKLATRLK